MRTTKILSCLLVACSLVAVGEAQRRANVTLFEGARLITGVGGAYGEDIEVVENSAFIVDNNRFTRVGRKGQVKLPAGAVRVDLTGKTVMPALVEVHGHVGYRKGTTNFIENYTEENVIDHLQRLAYHGVGAILSLGVDPRELGYLLRDKFRAQPPPDTVMFFTAGQGLAWPNAGPAYPMRPAPYGIRTEEQARIAVREMAAKRVDYIKIWVDDRRNQPKYPRRAANAEAAGARRCSSHPGGRQIRSPRDGPQLDSGGSKGIGAGWDLRLRSSALARAGTG